MCPFISQPFIIAGFFLSIYIIYFPNEFLSPHFHFIIYIKFIHKFGLHGHQKYMRITELHHTNDSDFPFLSVFFFPIFFSQMLIHFSRCCFLFTCSAHLDYFRLLFYVYMCLQSSAVFQPYNSTFQRTCNWSYSHASDIYTEEEAAASARSIFILIAPLILIKFFLFHYVDLKM